MFDIVQSTKINNWKEKKNLLLKSYTFLINRIEKLGIWIKTKEQLLMNNRTDFFLSRLEEPISVVSTLW